MKTRLKRLGAVLIAVLALTMALFPVGTAFADDPAEHSNQANITVSKTLETLQSGLFPNITSFQFLLEAVSYTPGPTSAGSISYTSANMPMPGGTTGPQAITINGFSPTAPGTTQTLSATTSNITYSQAGVYLYRLTERIPGTTDALGTVPGSPVAGVEYDETVYYVAVYVGNVLNDDGTVMLDASGNPVVNVYAMTAWETNPPANTDPTQPDNGGNPPIPNNPGELDDGKIGIVIPDDSDGNPRNISYPFVNDYNTASLVVTKKVSGDLGDPNLGFTFILNLTRPSGGTDTAGYPYQIYDMGADRTVGGTDDTAVSGGSGSIANGGNFTLKHNQYIRILGLPTGERVTTTEQGATDYKTTITVQHGTPGTPVTVKTDVTTNKTTNQQIIVTGTNAVNQQNFTNKKESIMPTGVLLDVLPYALLLAVGITGAVLILKKRRANEQ